MSITVKFPHKPSKEELEEFEKLVHKFAHIGAVDSLRQEMLIKKAKTPMDILACKYVAKYWHSETMKLIRKQEREVKKKQETKKK